MPADLPPGIICEAPRWHDADSVRCAGYPDAFRAFGYDSPEMTGSPSCRAKNRHRAWCDHAKGRQARDAVIRLSQRSVVRLHPTGDRSYGRQVARVTIDGRDLGEVLFGMGLARLCPDGTLDRCVMPGRGQ